MSRVRLAAQGKWRKRRRNSILILRDKRADTDLNRVVDQQRIMYYSANWQLLEERIDEDE